jgi:glycosyltransferase involved in cell wall biosynthesis
MTMHVVLLTPHTRVGGGTKVIFTLAKMLTNLGIETTVLTRVVSNLAWLGYTPQFKIIKVNSISKYTIPKTVTHIVNYGDNEVFGPMPDVPHILYLQNFGIHQYEKECLGLMYPYDAVVTVSKWLADIAAKQFKHKNVWIIPPGIDDKFIPKKTIPYINSIDLDPYWHWQKKTSPHKIINTDKLPTVGCLFHHAPSKNAAEFLQAMNKVYISTGKNVRVILLASKDVHKSTFEKVKYPYYIYVNPPPDRLPSLYHLCTVWVAPSIVEGFGLCPVEAMACGTPTIIKPSFGLDEFLVNKKNCLLTNVDSERSNMAMLIKTLLDNKELQTRLIQNGIELARNFTWNKFIDAFMRLFTELQ